jgi:DNA gyrase subunit B
MRRARTLRVWIERDWVTVEDDGPGIPVDVVPRHGKSALEIVFTVLRCGPTYDGHHPHVHMTNFGIGLTCVSALSTRTEVETIRDGRRYRMAFERGFTVEPLEYLGPTSRRGTRIRFRPDPTIFESVQIDPAPIAAELTNVAFLNPLREVRFQGEAIDGRGGPAGFVRAIAGDRLACPTVFATTRMIDDVFVDLAIGWRGRGRPDIRSFVNLRPTRSGTHVSGMWKGLGHALRRRPPAVRDLLAPGVVAVLHVGLFDPSFGSPTRDHLATPLAGPAVRRAIVEALPNLLRGDATLRAFLEEMLAHPTRL